ncbi:sulfite exporter TauE/SafE family protein, partial [Nostocoides australiense]|uniref:sulfite exporter TauE/SafE family protein n=1 Tax=Nostocoides australiense TaxID=99480 RepID=UPI00138ECD2B
MLLLTLTLALLVGVTLGLMGGGGSILMVPLLVYVARLAPGTAIAASLFVIGVTAIAAVLPHARGGRVQWRAGAVLGVAAMAGAYAGGRLAAYVPEWVLLATFALLMLATAIAMIRGHREETGSAASGALAVGPVLLAGVGVGLLTGFVGAGGGG